MLELRRMRNDEEKLRKAHEKADALARAKGATRDELEAIYHEHSFDMKLAADEVQAFSTKQLLSQARSKNVPCSFSSECWDRRLSAKPLISSWTIS